MQKVVFNKKYDTTFGLDDPIVTLKVHLAEVIIVPNIMQKVMFQGMTMGMMSLRQVEVVKGSKGKPEDVITGLKNIKESLPSVPWSGMLNTIRCAGGPRRGRETEMW